MFNQPMPAYIANPNADAPEVESAPLPRVTLLTPKYVRCALAISPSQLYKDVRTGHFPPPVHIGRRHSRFIASEVVLFINGLARGLTRDERYELVQAIVANRSVPGGEAA
ncbi:MAG: AlpA family phage regulatory protein [Rubrivivax sp.]|nr:AlpA family phage regulatory protein [Rubrivivax sp.]